MFRALCSWNQNVLMQSSSPMLACDLVENIYSRFSSSFSSSDCAEERKEIGKDIKSDLKLPEPPTNCCMSGCPNCVWIAYAEELSKIFDDSGEKSREIIFREISDENMKAFLRMELSLLSKHVVKD